MPHPDYAPQLATLVKEPPSDDGWVHEIKYDGYRIGCRIRGGRIALISRNGKDWTAAFPSVVAAAAALRTTDALIDGEVAIVLPDGRTSFQLLQNAFSGAKPGGPLVYFVFDLLRLDGQRLERLPLVERKARLRSLIGARKTGTIRYAEHVDGNGRRFFDQACRLGLEGIISKRRSEPYHPGRHGEWVKTKCVLEQEFVIGGFTDPEGSRAGIGALLIGYYDMPSRGTARAPGRLVFSGKVGTGFTHKGAIDLRRTLDALEQKACPFDPPPEGWLGRNAHWVKPQLVGEVVFTEWTGDGKIRHPAFKGLRADKKPQEVRRERPAATTAPKERAGKKARAQSERAVSPSTVAGVPITHPDRLLYPSPAITKIDVARYYAAIADWVVPHVAGRPLTLVRCPDGVSSDCFFMKHSKVWAPSQLRRVRIQEKKKVGDYLIADDLSAVVGLVQMGVLEIHTWNSTIDAVEKPNRIVIDLDPGERVAWPQVVAAARVIKRALEALELESFPKTTGGRGLHVVVPLVPHADWSACLDFSRALCETIEAGDPARYTTQFAKSGRANKILLDYLRNNRTNTSIAAYSTRARTGAPVSVPITWDELRSTLKPAAFTMLTVPRRLQRLSRDPWRDYWKSRQSLTAQRIKAIRHL
jgi:bifunctional non-homologous end joining protein LigD